MPKIVYILGAGFSANLGIPTISQFLRYALDQQENSESQEFKYFSKVFDYVGNLERAAYHYSTNADSIEDLLTLADMTGGLQDLADAEVFRRFIKDVIVYHTPAITADSLIQRWDRLLFAGDPWTPYIAFVAGLLGYKFKKKESFSDLRPTLSDYHCEVTQGPNSYAVVSMNYDLVLEKSAEYLANTYHQKKVAFTSSPDGTKTVLVKLHGSIDAGNIVPPVWTKQYEMIRKEWDKALLILSAATEIRIVGYSLAYADPYVRFLLRAAALRTRNLKRIDVLCKDDEGDVRKRYEEFVVSKAFWRRKGHKSSFLDSDTSTYLYRYQSHTQQWQPVVDCPTLLEKSHREHFP